MGNQLKGRAMQRHLRSRNSRRGITVLSLVLLIIAVVIVAIFLIPYLRQAG